jgi:hypothetical protein
VVIIIIIIIIITIIIIVITKNFDLLFLLMSLSREENVNAKLTHSHVAKFHEFT